ncbi:hypothetical protein [Lysinibacillus fusiformis]|uniref:hypothetical protein n=1 Tax=Lysinibacillus fusiformis TaxID=28031 RepID=UPI003D05427C
MKWPTRHHLGDRAARVDVTVDGETYQGWLEITQDEPRGVTLDGRYIAGLKHWRVEVSGGLFVTHNRGQIVALTMRSLGGHTITGDALLVEINVVHGTGSTFRSVFTGNGPLTMTLLDAPRSQP